MRPSVRSTSTLPGCGSPWKNPSTRTCLMIARMNTRPELGRVQAGRGDLVGVRDLDALDVLHGQDPRGRQLVDDVGHVDARELGHAVGDALGLVGLVAVVELAQHPGGELADDVRGPDLAGQREARLGHRRELLDDPQVGLGLGQDLRALDLDRDLPAVEGRGPVDLGGRGGGERLGLDRGEEGLRVAAELGQQDRPGLVPRERPGLALELGQLVGPLGRQQVAPAGQHLADLHVRRPEVLEQAAHPLRGRGLGGRRWLAEQVRLRPRPDAPDGRVGQGHVQARRVDRLVDLLEAQVLDEGVAPGRGQRLEEGPDRAATDGQRRSAG